MTDAAASSRPTPIFSPIVVLWMVLAAVFSAAAFLVLSAYAPDLRGGSDGGAHALSKSAVGYAGLVRLLNAEGIPADVNRDAGGQAYPIPSVEVLTPTAETPPKDVAAYAEHGQILVVAPKWQTTPEPGNPAFVNKAGVLELKAIQTLLKPFAPDLVMTRRSDVSAAPLGLAGHPTTGPVDRLQVFQTASRLDAIVRDTRGGVVLAATYDRRVYFLSDPDMINNHSLADLPTARAASVLMAMVRNGGGPVAFDAGLNGFAAAPSLLKLAFSPPYLGATLCLAAVGLLIGLCAAVTFGAPRRAGRALAFGKRALADNSAGLIRLARREPKMAPRYLDLTRAAVVKALGAGRAAPEDLDAILDRMAERGGVTGRLATLAPQARGARSVADLMKVVRALYQWRVEMTGEHR